MRQVKIGDKEWTVPLERIFMKKSVIERITIENERKFGGREILFSDNCLNILRLQSTNAIYIILNHY